MDDSAASVTPRGVRGKCSDRAGPNRAVADLEATSDGWTGRRQAALDTESVDE